MGLFVITGIGLGICSTRFIVGRGVGAFVVGRREGRCVGDFVLDISWTGLGVGGECVGFELGLGVVGFGVIICTEVEND